jgi:hypothetical protein
MKHELEVKEELKDEDRDGNDKEHEETPEERRLPSCYERPQSHHQS